MIEVISLILILVISTVFMVLGYKKDCKELFFSGAIAFIVSSTMLVTSVLLFLTKQIGGW